MRRLVPVLLLASCAAPRGAAPHPLDGTIPAILREDGIPGAVLVAGGVAEGVTLRKAYGTASVDTVFDLASCTKVVATTTAALRLVEAGRISLDDPVSRHLPAFAARDITVEELLRHRSGLPAYLRPRSLGGAEILREISRLERPKTTVYS